MNRFAGKFIASAIGFLTFGLVGLLIGLLIGHAFDRGLSQALQATTPENLARTQKQFFDATFTLLGYIAKVDGQISEAEIVQTEKLFQQLRLSSDQSQAAILSFKTGSQPGFNPAATVATFAESIGPWYQAQHTLLTFLVSMALVDGRLHESERKALHHIASLLKIPTTKIDHLITMISAQARFHSSKDSGHNEQSNNYAHKSSPKDQLTDAYQALGVKASASNGEIKNAYRRLMSEHHPDKLIAKGVPEEVIKVATKRSQEISVAYSVILKAKKKK